MDDKETNRLEAFSDGVFAVAITLLVLNIKIPGLDLSPDKLLPDVCDAGSRSCLTLWQTLLNEWPMLIAYSTSFATIGVMWLNHHRLYKHIKRINTALILLNLLLLALIVFIPVPTALLAEYLVRPDLHTAVLLYSGTNVFMAICFNLLWHYASNGNRLLGKNVDMRTVTAINQQYLFGPLFYVISFVVGVFSVPACITLNFIWALFFALPGRLVRPSPQKVTPEEDEVM